MSREPVAGDVIGGRYQLDVPIGRGGMGCVWRALDQRLGRDVAVKTIISTLVTDEVAVKRFEHEARAVAKVKSPHIVEVHDYGVDGCLYMVMELLDGEPLSKRLTRQGILPLGQVTRITDQIARALTVVHEHDIVHRDLKPGNIFMARDPAGEYVKVIDFGVAKALGAVDKTTREKLIIGTVSYMGPEQLRDENLDSRADLWSLAVIIYRCLTGRRPYRGATFGEAVAAVLTQPPPHVTALNPSLPVELDAFFERAFARDIEQRFATAAELAEALREVAELSVSDSVVLQAGDSELPDEATTVALVSSDMNLPSQQSEATLPTRALAVTMESKDHPAPSRLPWLVAAAVAAIVVSVALAITTPWTPRAANQEPTSAPPAPPPVDHNRPVERTTIDSVVDVPVEPTASATATVTTSPAPAPAPVTIPKTPRPSPGPPPPPAPDRPFSDDDIF